MSWLTPGCVCALVLPVFTVIYLIVIKATPSLAVEFPSGCRTIEHFVYRVIGLNPQAFAASGALTEKETWRILRIIISDQLGVREEDIKPEVRFIEDLNAG